MMHDFDQLPSLMSKAVAEFEQDDVRLLERVREQMFVDTHASEAITKENAQSWAHHLFERVRYGARALGHATVFSGEAADVADFLTAKLEVRRFLDTCDIPYYRRIAEDRLQEYMEN